MSLNTWGEPYKPMESAEVKEKVQAVYPADMSVSGDLWEKDSSKSKREDLQDDSET